MNAVENITGSQAELILSTATKEYTKEQSNTAKKNDSVIKNESKITSTDVSAGKNEKISETEKTAKDENLTEKILEEKQEENKEISNEKNQPQLISNTSIQFRIVDNKDEKTGEISKELVVYLLDKNSGEVVRKIPPDEYNDITKKEKFYNYPFLGYFVDEVG